MKKKISNGVYLEGSGGHTLMHQTGSIFQIGILSSYDISNNCKLDLGTGIQICYGSQLYFKFGFIFFQNLVEENQ